MIVEKWNMDEPQEREREEKANDNRAWRQFAYNSNREISLAGATGLRQSDHREGYECITIEWNATQEARAAPRVMWQPVWNNSRNSRSV